MPDPFSFVNGSRSELLDALRQHRFRLGHDGFVRFVDVMGSDEAIVQAARVSYGAGTKSVSDDRGLIRYLLRHRHTTPLEMCEVKLHVRVPMDTWRQWIRHRTANVNEYSTRYSEAIDCVNHVEAEDWRHQSSDNKQGSSGGIEGFPEGYDLIDQYSKFWKVCPPGQAPDETDSHVTFSNIYEDDVKPTPGAYLTAREYEFHRRARALYEERLKFGVAREQARKDLPLSTYTEAYWKIDLHNLLHFLGLRMDKHAQQEIREYANVIGDEIVSRLFPVSYEAFEDYILHAIQLSRLDQDAIMNMLQGHVFNKDGENTVWTDWLPKEWQGKRSRERDEFLDKLRTLGFNPVIQER
jgi:thymidylate synthase (FAD)